MGNAEYMGSFVSNCYLNIVILKICLKFKMNQLFALSALVCVLAVPVLSTIELAIGGLTLTAAQTTLLGAGLLGAKLLGVGVGAGLASKGRGRSRSYSRAATERAIAEAEAMAANVTEEMFPTTKSTNQNFFSNHLKYLTQLTASVVTFAISPLVN